MRFFLLFLLIALFIGSSLNAQIKIGDNPQNIDPSSVLELESTDKVLVITRVTTEQMNAIVPIQGALAYNTDLQSVHYYDGAQWVDIGGAGGAGGPFSTDPIENTVSTIVITPLNGGSNFEVAPNSIRTEQIVDGGITGVDIQNGSIGPGKLTNNSVIKEKISENAVGPFALQRDSLPLSYFNNDVPFLTAADLVDVGGTDDQNLMGATLNASNILQIDIENGNSTMVDLSSLAGGGGTDDQNLTLTGNIIEIEDGNTIDLTPILGSGGGGTEVADQTTITGVGTNADPFKIEPGTADQILKTANDGLSVLWADLPTGGAVITDMTLNGDGSSMATALGLADNAVNSAKIENGTILAEDINDMGATDGQVLKWNDTATAWEVADDATGAPTLSDGNIFVGDALNAPQNVTMSGDATIDNLGALTIEDDAINTAKIEDFSITAADLNDMGATTDGEILQWDTTANEGVGGWAVTNNSGGHSGTAKSIFFANTDGTPTTADDNVNPNDDGGFIWDTEARQLGGNTYGALFVGLQAGSPVSNSSKVIISERVVNGHPQQGLAYPLQIQNENGANTGGASTGILFAVDAASAYGKGGLVYERKDAGGVGDFHFLQNTVGDNTIPTLADKVFTIENDGDIVLAGDLIAKNGAGALNQVLTITATGTEWADSSGAGGTNLSNTDLTQTVGEDRTYDLNGQDLVFTGSGNIGMGLFGIVGQPPVPDDKLDVNGQIRARDGFTASPGTVNLPSYGFYTNDDNDTGMYRIEEDQLGFSVGGGLALTVRQTVANGLEVIANGSLELEDQLIDSNGNPGTNGQILSSTATGTHWVDNSVAVEKEKILSATGTTGAYTINVTQPNANYIINLTVQENPSGNPIMIQVTNQTAANFSVQIYEFIAGTPTPTNADWFYTIYNP